MSSESPTGTATSENGPPPRRLQRARPNGADLRRLQEDLREAQFPIALRGYDRDAVDRYVKDARHVIAELELSGSPEAAVRHALDEVSEETSGLLQRAYETAEEIQARSRAKADDRIQQAEREAQTLREEASREADEDREAAQREAAALRETARREASEVLEAARRESDDLLEAARRESAELRATAKRETGELRTATESRVEALERHAETVLRERRRLIDDMRAVAKEQLEIADAAAARFPQNGAAGDHAPPQPEGAERQA
jgi:DivIVA domain-containing protein